MNATLRLFDGFDHTSPHLSDTVKHLQKKLTEAGYPTDIDGLFGRDTEEAVIKYQRNAGLVDDGIVGPNTWAEIDGRPQPGTRMYETTYAFHDPGMLSQLTEAQKYADWIRWAAQDAGVHQSIIAGIGSRESHWGLALRPPTPAGTGDWTKRKRTNEHRHGDMPNDGNGFGRGLMQIDYDAHEFARTGEWKDAARNIAYGGIVLRENVKYIAQRKPELKGEALLRSAVAAYNCGAGNVLKALSKKRSVDYFTAHRDYSRDVLSRAGWFQMHGW